MLQIHRCAPCLDFVIHSLQLDEGLHIKPFTCAELSTLILRSDHLGEGCSYVKSQALTEK